MDLRNLMQKLETIDKKKTLTESTAPQSKKVISESTIKQKEPIGDIERQLLEAFGLYEAEAIQNPYDPNSAEGKLFPQLSPEDQAWLTKGGEKPAFADDPAMKSRMPNKGNPVAQAPAPQTTPQSGAQTQAVPEPAQVDTKPLDTPAPQTGAEGSGQAAPQQPAPQQPAPVIGGDPKVVALQQELKKAGANLGTFGPGKDGIDGKFGKATAAALAANPEIAKKYPELASKAQKMTVAKPATPGAPAQGGQVPPTQKGHEGSGQAAPINGETGRVELANTIAEKEAELAALNKEAQTTRDASMGDKIERKQMEIDQYKKQLQGASMLPKGAATPQAIDASKKTTLDYLQKQLAAAKDPRQKQYLQAAINSVNGGNRLVDPGSGLPLPDEVVAQSANNLKPVTQSIEHTGSALSEDDAVLASIRRIRY